MAKTKVHLVSDADQQFSSKSLAQYYEKGTIPPEKKPFLADYRHSVGPLLAVESDSKQRKYILDAASQIATLGMGFNPAPFFGPAHSLMAWENQVKGSHFQEIRKSFESFLSRKLGHSELYTHFCQGGAEANELALGMAYKRRKNPKAKKILAFEGSFHGRLQLVLCATWNPVKRQPFEWEETKAHYCQYPELPDDNIWREFPDDWIESWENSVRRDFQPKFKSTDESIEKEIECLMEVREGLASGDIFAIIIEPMQCEGGDRYSSDRFHNALVAMANSFQVEIVYDEVQTGIHLGREFFWHKAFCLRDSLGNPRFADYVGTAKKAQTGIVVSHLPSPFHQEFHAASVMRGYVQSISLDQKQQAIIELENRTRTRLKRLMEKYPESLTKPRARGMAFAIELKDKQWVPKFVAKRFEYGLLYYPAGESTLRFRTNLAFTDDDLDFLFGQLDLLCQEIIQGKEVVKPLEYQRPVSGVEKVYRAQNLLIETKFEVLRDQKIDQKKKLEDLEGIFLSELKSKLFVINKDNFEKYRADIQNIQETVYEPTRRTEIELFKNACEHENGICMGLEIEGELAAIAFSAPLKLFRLEKGVRRDPHFEDEKSLYCMDTTVIDRFRGLQLGKLMKFSLSLIAAIKNMNRLQGRNRDRLASSMLDINLSLGAKELNYLEEDYLDDETFRDTFYYTSNTSWERPEAFLTGGIESPISYESMDEDFVVDSLPAVVNKVCLSNFVTRDFLTDLDKVFDLLPKELARGYTTSGQSEGVDKIIKSLWLKKGPRKKLMSFNDMFFGSASFFSRSLSDSEDAFFDVTHLDRPNGSNQDQVLNQAKKYLQDGHYLAVFVEPLLQNSMEPIEESFLVELKKLCADTGTALVYNETASQMYRYHSDYYFVANNPALAPDMGYAYLGGQAGFVYSNSENFLDKPLMLISTWDGDEFSLDRYCLALEQIKSDKSSFDKVRSEFNQKLVELLGPYQTERIELENGIGFFSGRIPSHLQTLFRQVGDRFLVCPSYDEMKNFLKR